jgi:acyl-CoA synthetase
VLLPDGIDPHVAYVAAEKAGLVIVGIGPRAGVEEIRHLLERTGAAAWLSPAVHRDVDLRVCFEEFRSEGLPLRRHLVVEPGAPLGAGDGAGPAPPLGNGLAIDDLFLLNSTSGTTGLPKCVTHDQRRWLHFHELAVAGAELRGSDVFASAIPTPFGFGLWTAHFTPTLLGSPTVLLETFNAEALIEALERQRVSVLAAVSTQFIMMLNSPALADADLSSLRVLYTGGEAVPYERAAEFEDRTGAAVLQFYGSNETGALSCTTLRDSRESRLRTAGHLIESMSVRLFDAAGNDVTATGKGQPGCRGPLTSQGYYDDEAANAKLYTKDGWMLTGDIASLDADGTLRIIGRTADFIIRGGKNISGTAVERAVSAHPAVALAAAVAMPDPVYGERVCVYVELHAPGRNRPHASAALTLDALVAFLRERQVSVETLPERLVVVDALPRSSGGKVAKGQLREDIRARLSREA